MDVGCFMAWICCRTDRQTDRQTHGGLHNTFRRLSANAKCNYSNFSFQEQLLAREVCDELTAQSVIAEQCLPVVGVQQRSFETKLENMDVSKDC